MSCIPGRCLCETVCMQPRESRLHLLWEGGTGVLVYAFFRGGIRLSY
jgi:hypothetical protein